MTTIKINTEEPVDYVELEDVVDFNHVVIKGNRDYWPHEEAPWWKEAIEYISDMDCYGTDDDCKPDYDYDWGKLTKEQTDAIIKLYDKCQRSDDYRFIMKVIKVLHPELKIEGCTIRGYCQSDWQDVIYETDKVDIDLLEAVYFGKITDIIVENGDDCYGDWITDDELWKAERNEDNLADFFRKRFDIPDDEEIEIYKSNGIIRTIRWEKVG